MSKKIAITGANSFIGKAISDYLWEEGENFIVLDLKRPKVLPKDIPFYKIDFTQPTSDVILADILNSENVDTLIHLAYISSPTKNFSLEHELEVIGTMHVLHAVAATKIKRVIFKSTTMVYGANSSNPNFLTEKHKLMANPKYHFVREKVESENLISDFRKKHKDISITVLRLASIIGSNIDYYLTRILNQPLLITLLGFDPLYQILHEDDAVKAFITALYSDKDGIFNIASEGLLPVSIILKLMGKIPIPVFHPLAYSIVDGMWLTGLSPIPPAHLDYIRYLSVTDISKSKDELGFIPEYSIKKAIEDFSKAQRLKKVRLLFND